MLTHGFFATDSYRVDFNALKQVNMKSGSSRNVRRNQKCMPPHQVSSVLDSEVDLF